MAVDKTVLEVGGRPIRVVRDHFIGSVDNAFLTKSGAHLTCWSIVSPSKRPAHPVPAQFLVVNLKGAVLAAEPNRIRPDISRKFGEETLLCGLRLDLSVDWIPEPLVAKFEVFAYNGLDVATRLDFFSPNDHLNEVAVNSPSDFMRLVQDPSTRSRNKSTLLNASLHAVRRFEGNFVVCAAAACVVGYRILDHEVDDPDIRAIFHSEIDRLLPMRPDLPKGLFLRWHTSLRLIAGYLTYQEGHRERSRQHFDRILDFVGDLPLWPTALTNILIGVYVSGYLLFEEGRLNDAVERWGKAEALLRTGSELANYRNYYAYGELINAINIARECHMAILVARSGGPLRDAKIAPVGLGLDPRTVPGPFGRLSGEYRAVTGEADPLASYKGVRPPR